MAEARASKRRSERGVPAEKSRLEQCSLKSCLSVIDGNKCRRVGVAVTPYASDLIDWGESGEGLFHTECWEELVRNTRVRNPKRATIKIETSEKEILKEAAKTVEYHDAHSTIQSQSEQIAHLIAQSQHCIAFTGAGISTSAGIGDYRGKSGKWTKQDRQTDESDDEDNEGVAYELLRPTYTHESIAKLVQMGLVKHVISQNGDGLHGLSGIPADQLSELHGNVFEETCEQCGHIYSRSYYVLDDNCSQYYEDINESGRSNVAKPAHAEKCPQCSLSHRTGRKCDKCSGFLKDSIINFGDNLREDVLLTATDQAKSSDLCLSLGTTMTVTPASDLVLMGQKPIRLVIINRQKTDFDYLCEGRADSVRVFGDCDDVLKCVMVHLMEEKERIQWENERQKRLNNYDKQRDNI